MPLPFGYANFHSRIILVYNLTDCLDRQAWDFSGEFQFKFGLSYKYHAEPIGSLIVFGLVTRPKKQLVGKLKPSNIVGDGSGKCLVLRIRLDRRSRRVSGIVG